MSHPPAPINTDPQTQTPELAAYYADRPLMIRNVALIGICNVGWAVTDTLVVPLVMMRLLELGVRENVQGSIGRQRLGAEFSGDVFFVEERSHGEPPRAPQTLPLPRGPLHRGRDIPLPGLQRGALGWHPDRPHDPPSKSPPRTSGSFGSWAAWH
jgi:hypothetical protein